MPEGTWYRSWYGTGVEHELQAFLGGLRDQFGADVVDARTWVADEEFNDSHHLLQSGAACFTDRLTQEGVDVCAAEAVAIAKASALAKHSDVALAPEKPYVDTWQNPFIKDPFRIPVERQIEVLRLFEDEDMLAPKEIFKHLKGNVPLPTIKQALGRLVQLRLLKRVGLGRATRYRKI